MEVVWEIDSYGWRIATINNRKMFVYLPHKSNTSRWGWGEIINEEEADIDFMQYEISEEDAKENAIHEALNCAREDYE